MGSPEPEAIPRLWRPPRGRRYCLLEACWWVVKTTGVRKAKDRSPEPNVPMFGAEMKFFGRQTRGYGQKRPKRADTRGGGHVSRRRSGSFGCCATLRGRRKVLQRPTKRGMDRRLGATTPRADTTGSRALSSAWRQARDEKGDRERRRLYLYSRSAISRSAAHDETRRRHLCYFGNE